MNQARFVVGVFSIFPAFGIVLPGAQQVITVEVFAELSGKSEEILHIDITDRDPNDNPGGIPYRLVTEACLPGRITPARAGGRHSLWGWVGGCL
uniref:Cadherin domain-containing protein n=1 Tax=Callorhinchus milii TaxID=7868 RepID=A0A4W3H2C0_CALMI